MSVPRVRRYPRRPIAQRVPRFVPITGSGGLIRTVNLYSWGPVTDPLWPDGAPFPFHRLPVDQGDKPQ